jgi:hypothetical protein
MVTGKIVNDTRYKWSIRKMVLMENRQTAPKTQIKQQRRYLCCLNQMHRTVKNIKTSWLAITCHMLAKNKHMILLLTNHGPNG